MQSGQRINIDKNIYIDILWPATKQISENPLNNNSIVCKLYYNNFNVLFTGDIEKIAEQEMLKKINNNLLKSDVLKVAHHGSKTSSIQGFIGKVQPKIALIGVGQDNKFGHPNEDVIKRLESVGTRIFRTDKNREITITVNKKGKIWINKMLN